MAGNKWLEKAKIMGLSNLTQAKFEADQKVFKELADQKLLNDEANKARRKEAFNSKEGQQARHDLDQLAARSTHSGADTMEKYAQMLKKGIANLLNGHSKYNKILNMLYDAPGYIQSKLPHQGAPIKCPKPSEALIFDNSGQLKFNPDCKATVKEKQLALDFFRLHMANNGFKETGIIDQTTGIESFYFNHTDQRKSLQLSELNTELKSSDESIKKKLGTNIDWLEPPEDNTPSPS